MVDGKVSFESIINSDISKGKGKANGTSNGDNNELRNSWDEDRDVWWHEEMEDAEASCYPVWMDAEDPLFILYTRFKKKEIYFHDNFVFLVVKPSGAMI